jgi:hypothetical protein
MNSVLIVIPQDDDLFWGVSQVICVEDYYLPILVHHIATIFGNLIWGIECGNKSPRPPFLILQKIDCFNDAYLVYFIN